MCIRDSATAIQLNDARTARDPKARNLRDLYKNDPRFDPVRASLQLP